MKKNILIIEIVILILILICLSSFVLAEDISDNHCGNGICESFEETEGNCCEDCGGCNDITVETGVMDVVKPSVMDVDTGIIDVVDKEKAGEIIEKKKGIFNTIIDFFKRLFGMDTGENQRQKSMASPEADNTVEPGVKESQTDSVDIVKEYSDKLIDQNINNDTNNEKDIIKDFGGESVCGDGICDDYIAETQENCPQDCGYIGEVIPGDDFEGNYDKIMAEMKDIIPDVPEEEKHMDITSFHTPSATCYFSAGASLANYMEDISYDEFIWYGRPFNFKYDTRWNTLRTGVGGGELTFESFYNLGYKSYAGRTEKNYPPTPERLHMKASYSFIFFDTNEEALDFIKRLMSADIPIMVNLQVGRTQDYHFIKGYDKTHVFIPPYVNVKTKEYIFPDEMPLFNQEAYEWKETQVLTYEEFFSLWEETGDTFYWFVKNKERKTEQEMFQINRNDAGEAYDNVQKFIKNPDFKSYSSDGDLITATASASRYLTKENYTELGKKYMELAAMYDKKRSQWETVNMYPQTAELYKEAEGLWQG